VCLEVTRLLDSVDKFTIAVGESVSEIGRTGPQLWGEYQVRWDVIGKLKKRFDCFFSHQEWRNRDWEDMPNQSENRITDSYAARGPRSPSSALASLASRLMEWFPDEKSRSVRRGSHYFWSTDEILEIFARSHKL
jgi:hypothetical protein